MNKYLVKQIVDGSVVDSREVTAESKMDAEERAMALFDDYHYIRELNFTVEHIGFDEDYIECAGDES